MNEMQTPFLLTLISDSITDLNDLIERLKRQDGDCNSWKDIALGNLSNNLFWLQQKVEARRAEVLKEEGKEPDSYKF